MQTVYSTLKNLNEGDIVRVRENGVFTDFIVSKHGYPLSTSKNTLLTRRYAESRSKWEDDYLSKTGNNWYAGSTLDRYLNNEYSKKINDYDYLSLVNIEMTNNDGVKYSLGRRAFALSATEVGYGPANGTNPIEGTKIPYFDNVARRICQTDNSSKGVQWLLRTRNANALAPYLCWSVMGDGDYRNETWQDVEHYVRPSICFPSNITVSITDNIATIIGNLPPEAPEKINIPSTVYSQSDIQITWDSAADADSSDISYRLERSIDGGSTWETVTTTARTSYSDILAYKQALMVKYRICAYDQYWNTSEYTESINVNVTNNVAPSAPTALSIGNVIEGEQITIGWGPSTDDDNNFEGYEVSRKIDDGEWEVLGNTVSRSITTVCGNWNTVTFRVRAYDSHSAYSAYNTSETIAVTHPQVISASITPCDMVENETILVTPNSPNKDYNFELNFTDSYAPSLRREYLVEYFVDNTPIYEETSFYGQTIFAVDSVTFTSLLSGKHTISCKVTCVETGVSGYAYLTFNKKVCGVEITLRDPIVLSKNIEKCIINVQGEFTEGDFSVFITNNAGNDWQEVPFSQLNSNEYIVFDTEGEEFNYRILSGDIESVEPGTRFIESINGVVGENIFESIFSRLSALES